MFDWTDIRLFLSVYRKGTFTGASQELKLDQTTIGRRVSALEAALQTKLFRRGKSGLIPTVAGQDLVELALRMEEEALSIERRLSGRDTEPKGTVRVTSLESFSTYFLANRLGEFCERFPQIELDLYTDSRSLNLSRREADIALRMAKPTQEGLITKKIATIGYALYGAKEGKSGRFLGYSEELSTIPEYRWLKERSPEGFAMRSNSVGVLAKASSKGAGLAVLPCFVGDLEQGLRRVEPPREVLSRELWLIVHPELQGRRDIRAVMSFISEVVTAAKGMLAG